MTAIAARFLPLGSDAEVALTQANRAMPGTVAGGRSITVDGQALATEPGDSFDAVIARADPPVTIEAFAAAIADDPDALATGGLLLCGPALTGDAALTPPDLGARYGLDPTLILSANAATPGVIVAGLTLRPSPVAATPTVTTAADDSLNAIIRRFAAAGIAVTIGDVVTGNADQAWIAAAAKLLLPPADAAWVAGRTSWREARRGDERPGRRWDRSSWSLPPSAGEPGRSSSSMRASPSRSPWSAAGST